MDYLKRPLTVQQIKDQVRDNRLKVVVALDFCNLACISEDGTLDGLNDAVDELILPKEIGGPGLLDINYKPKGVDGDMVLFEVDGDASEILDAIEEDEEESRELLNMDSAEIEDMQRQFKKFSPPSEEDDEEEQRRDEKRGLYPEHEDPAN